MRLSEIIAFVAKVEGVSLGEYQHKFINDVLDALKWEGISITVTVAETVVRYVYSRVSDHLDESYLNSLYAYNRIKYNSIKFDCAQAVKVELQL